MILLSHLQLLHIPTDRVKVAPAELARAALPPGLRFGTGLAPAAAKTTTGLTELPPLALKSLFTDRDLTEAAKKKDATQKVSQLPDSVMLLLRTQLF